MKRGTHRWYNIGRCSGTHSLMEDTNGGSLVGKETNTIVIASKCTSLRKTTLTDYVQNDWLSNRLNRKTPSNEKEKTKSR